VRRSLIGDLFRLVAAGLVALVLLGAFGAIRVLQVGERDERGHVVDAIVVLGAAHYDGRPSPVFRARLDHAVELYLNGTAPILVVTGGRAPGDRIAEAEVAHRYAVRSGVPETAILSEQEGHDTLSSLRNAAALMRRNGIERALFVSDRTHMLRVLRIASDLGITAYGSPTRTSPVDRDDRARAEAVMRELAALAAYLALGR
jgi:uncharacterized SAM-binding protein YcdF (DUF218 family)